MTPAPRLIDRLESGFQDAVVIVIGGGGGVGRAVCAATAGLGARVVSASRRGDEMPKPPASGGICDVRLDVTEPDSIAAFAAWIGTTFGRIDVLVLSAGVTRSVPARDLGRLDDDLIDLVFESNTIGPLRLIRDLRPSLENGRDPVIVNVSSVAARTGIGSNLAYVGAKGAMDSMMIGLAKALAPRIRMVAVAPSALDTDFAQGRGPDFIDRTIAATPLARLATTEEVADAVLCAARLLPMTTGVTIFVDGGRHL